ncbi:hypothetical protein ACFQ12_02845 [Methylobacterium trifolii]
MPTTLAFSAVTPRPTVQGHLFTGLAAKVAAAFRRGREAELARRCALIDRTGIAGLI